MSLQNGIAFLECGNNIDVFADFALLDEVKHSLLEFVGFYRIFLVEGIPTHLFRKDLGFTPDELRFHIFLTPCAPCLK